MSRRQIRCTVIGTIRPEKARVTERIGGRSEIRFEREGEARGMALDLRADVLDAELTKELELRPERRVDRQRCDRRLRAEDRAHVAHARLVQYVEASNSLLKQ